MKLVLLVLLGLGLGLLGGALLGIGAGLAWTTVFNTSNFEGYSGMLVFLTFMPIGGLIGGLWARSASGSWPPGPHPTRMAIRPRTPDPPGAGATSICAMQ